MQEQNPSITILMIEVSRLMRRAFLRKCADGQFPTQAQARTLVYLSRHEGIRQVELADMLEVQPITLARQIDQMEKMGIVERRADPLDRRAYCLYLLPAATEPLAQIKKIGDELRKQTLQGLSPEQVNMLFDGLLAMRSNLTRMSEQES